MADRRTLIPGSSLLIPFYHCARSVAKKRLRKISGIFWIIGCTNVVMNFARQAPDSRFCGKTWMTITVL
jgi:hypothetical protein